MTHGTEYQIKLVCHFSRTAAHCFKYLASFYIYVYILFILCLEYCFL